MIISDDDVDPEETEEIVELTADEREDIQRYYQRFNEVKRRYETGPKSELENNPELIGCYIVFYKNQVWCLDERCDSFDYALELFQRKLGGHSDAITDVFYLTRIGYADPVPSNIE